MVTSTNCHHLSNSILSLKFVLFGWLVDSMGLWYLGFLFYLKMLNLLVFLTLSHTHTHIHMIYIYIIYIYNFDHIHVHYSLILPSFSLNTFFFSHPTLLQFYSFTLTKHSVNGVLFHLKFSSLRCIRAETQVRNLEEQLLSISCNATPEQGA